VWGERMKNEANEKKRREGRKSIGQV
jgi:hypothetical protein